MGILDFILNRAGQGEIDAIVAALERRRASRMIGAGPEAVNIGAHARKMSAELAERASYSVDSVRSMVNGFVRDMVRKEAPEITEEQLDVLLENWGATADGTRKSEPVRLPPEKLLSMVGDFLDYSGNAMTASRQAELRDSLGDWQSRYWESFPPELRTLIGALLKGRIQEGMFWKAAKSVLGL